MDPRALACGVVAAALSVPATVSGTVLPGVPSYYWYHGCSPTSGGMMVGYWDGLPGYENLFYGDASVETRAVRDMIASPNHIQDPLLQHPSDCIADFMQTDAAGYTDWADIGPGLEQYIEWDNPDTPVNESHEATVTTYQAFGGLSWELFKGQIDAGRPVLMNLYAYVEGEFLGHSVVGYGYQDDMFEISLLDGAGQVNLTVGGFTVQDTWGEGTSGSSWWGWDRDPCAPVEPVIDGQGHEWWPWLDMGLYPEDPMYEWFAYQAVTLDIIVPEPTTAALLAASCLVLIPRRVSRRRTDR